MTTKAASQFRILDWAGNATFPGVRFATFEDGCEFLDTYIRETYGELGDKEYSDIRGEYYVEECV